MAKKNETKQPLADQNSANGSTSEIVTTSETTAESADVINEIYPTSPESTGEDPTIDTSNMLNGAAKAIVETVLVPIYTPNEHTTIVVCGGEEAIPLLEKAWKRAAGSAKIICMGVDADTPFHYLLTSIIADERVPDKFVFVPASCFPTHKVTLSDLITPRVRLLTDGTQTVLTRLPMLLESDYILKTLEALKSKEEVTEEVFFEKYNELAYSGVLIEQISMGSGNLVGYVTNPNPCMAKVAEALIRKKFICTNDEGFTPIQGHLAQLYGK